MADTGNSVVFWADNPGAGSTLTIAGSLLKGGAYTLALYNAGAGSRIVIDVHSNTFAKNTWKYGPCATTTSVPFDGTSGIKFTGNTLDDGTPLTHC
jgi:hypothetical protein